MEEKPKNRFFIILDIIFSILNILNIIFGIIGLVLEFNHDPVKFSIWTIFYITSKLTAIMLLSFCLVCLKDESSSDCCGCCPSDSKENEENQDHCESVMKLVIKLLGLPFFISGIVILYFGFNHLLLYYHILIQVILYIPSIFVAFMTFKDVRRNCYDCCKKIKIKNILRIF